MHCILFLRCHARLKSRLRAAVMWQMHVINKLSFAHFKLLYWKGGCCELKRTWFYCLLRSCKSTLQLCGLSEHIDVAFITNQNGYDSSVTAMYFERFWFTEAVHAVFQELYCYYVQCTLYMHNMLLRRLNIRHMRRKWRVVNIYRLPPVRQFSFYRIPCSASLFQSLLDVTTSTASFILA